MDQWIGKVALVTGASVGIGAGITRALAEAGMTVVGIARNIVPIEAIRDTVTSEKGSILAMKCDVEKIEEIDTVFETIIKKFGGVDVCINNAGFTTSNPLLEGTPSEWKSMMNVNVVALCYCSKLAVQSMVERNVEGHIINISSLVAHQDKSAFNNINFYCATKHAVKFISEGLRQEIIERKHNIRVTAISPGAVATEFGTRGFSDRPELLEVKIPFLSAQSVVDSVLYALSTAKEVEINDIVMKPMKKT